MSEHHMPQPGPEHEVLQKMVGDWVSEETMHPSPWCPEPSSTKGRSVTRMFEGFFAVTDYEQEKDGEVSFRGHGVYGWDPATREYVMYWVDSLGGAGGVARGTYEDGVLTFRNSSPMGENRYRYTLGDGEMQFQIATSRDGTTWRPMMDSVYRRI